MMQQPGQVAAQPPSMVAQPPMDQHYQQYQQQQPWMAQQQVPPQQMWPQQPPPQYQQQPQQQPPASADEVRTLWIGDLQYWMDENYIRTCFAHTGEVYIYSLDFLIFCVVLQLFRIFC